MAPVRIVNPADRSEVPVPGPSARSNRPTDGTAPDHVRRTNVAANASSPLTATAPPFFAPRSPTQPAVNEAETLASIAQSALSEDYKMGFAMALAFQQGLAAGQQAAVATPTMPMIGWAGPLPPLAPSYQSASTYATSTYMPFPAPFVPSMPQQCAHQSVLR